MIPEDKSKARFENMNGYKVGDKVWLGNYTAGTITRFLPDVNQVEIVSPVKTVWGSHRHFVGYVNRLSPATQDDLNKVIP